jgi:hypothetical protein
MITPTTGAIAVVELVHAFLLPTLLVAAITVGVVLQWRLWRREIPKIRPNPLRIWRILP